MLTRTYISLAIALLSLLPQFAYAREKVSAPVYTHEEDSLKFVTPDDSTAKAITGIHPVIGLSSNLLYDITYIPNLGVTSVPSFGIEFYPAKGHWTFGADVDWSHWRHYDSHRFNQIHNITLSTRRYFK
ncbi:MAG: hypothetical protein J6Y88_05455, partial [Bacteroidales bacterium]|nr:hypothetical protein [Bacteroidales bacterium]